MTYILKRINNHHLDYFIKIKQNNDVLYYLQNNKMYDIDDITKWFQNLNNETNTDRFIICNNTNHSPMGDICISDIDYINMNCNLHIKILPEYWNLKIGSSVVNDILHYCKTILKLNCVNVQIHESNTRSINLFKKFNAIFIENKNNFNYYIITL